jgi:predicted helicase
VWLADDLKRELPRIPFAPDFRAFAAAGKELAALHVDYEKLEQYPLKWITTQDMPLSYRVEDKLKLISDKATLRVNPSLTLTGIPPELFQYGLGTAALWSGSSTCTRSNRTNAAASAPTRTGRMTRNTSCAWSAKWCT